MLSFPTQTAVTKGSLEVMTEATAEVTAEVTAKAIAMVILVAMTDAKKVTMLSVALILCT
jgi:hypothetical protein